MTTQRLKQSYLLIQRAKVISILLMVAGVLSCDAATFSEEIAVLKGHKVSSNPIRFSPDSSMLLTGDGTIKVWDVKSRQVLLAVSKSRDAAFMSDNRTVAVCSNKRVIEFWDIKSKKKKNKRIFIGFPEPSRFVLSPDESMVAIVLFDKTVLIHHIATVKDLAILKGHQRFVTAISFSPDGKWLATADLNGMLIITDCKTWKRRCLVQTNSKRVYDLCFSPDSKMLATAGFQGAVLWNMNTKNSKRPPIPTPLGGMAKGVCFSPDSRILVVAPFVSTDFHGVYLFDIQKKTITSKILPPKSWRANPYSCVAISPNGKYMAIGSARVSEDKKQGDNIVSLRKLATD